MPPSGFRPTAVRGLLVFVKDCYEHLLEDVRSGKFASYEEAIRFEIGQIEKGVASVHIDEQGRLTQR